MTSLPVLKGIRTRYRNILYKELNNAKGNNEDVILEDEKSGTIENAKESIKILKSYKEKTEDQMIKVTEAIGNDDDEFVNKVLDEDLELQFEVEKCIVRLENVIDSLSRDINEIIKPEEKVVVTSENETKIIEVQEQMQILMEAQLQQQKQVLEQQKKIELQESNSVKLPKIDLCSFNGNKLRWVEFWDTFECTIHRNKKLSNIEKFSYLFNKLQGEARRAVSGIALSNDNYEIAINILKERFGNKQDIVDLHYKELMKIPPASNKVYSLRSFLNQMERHLRSLEELEENINQHVFLSMIRDKLPEDVLRQLEFNKGSKTEWTLIQLRDQIREYVSACEKSERKPFENRAPSQRRFQQERQVNIQSKFESSPQHRQSTSVTFPHSSESIVARDNTSQKQWTQSKKCRYCDKPHWSDECTKYLTIEDRKRKLKDSCFRCLREGHGAKECKANKACVYCGNYNVHYRSLCPKQFKVKQKTENAHLSDEIIQDSSKDVESVTIAKESTFISTGERVLMQTAVADVRNPNSENKSEHCRILFDCGSQRSYITQQLAEKLGLNKEKVDEISLVTFGSKDPKLIKTASTTVCLRLKNGNNMKLSVNIVPVISGTIQRREFDVSSVKNIEDILRSVDLADSIPKENEKATVELLIGNDFYLDIVLQQRIEIHPGLYLLSSKLGWLLTGRTMENCGEERNESNMLILTHGECKSKTNVFQGVDSSIPTKPELEDLWKTEAIGVVDREVDSEDTLAMDRFNETLTFEGGRYYVTWPWKEGNEVLPINKELAYGRLKSCVNKLKNKPEILEKYDSIIKEQLNKGVIEKVDSSIESDRIHYIPHHAVINPEKTTKIRVVYDASSTCKREYNSLNECLYRGPVMLHDLCGLLMRFRLHNIAVIADIETAFLQIGLQQSERDVTRFLWLKSYKNPRIERNNIQEFRFCRVPFGVISSPFLLGATIENHLDKYDTAVAKKIKNDIYVDNVITGTKTEEKAIALYFCSKEIFNVASMNLREWVSNSDTVNQAIAIQDRSDMKSTSVLGHTWNSKLDCLTLKQLTLQSDFTIFVYKVNSNSKRGACHILIIVFL